MLRAKIITALFLVIGFGLALTAILSKPPIPESSLSDLNLSGRLILAQGTEGLHELDLSTGTTTALFVPPRYGIVNSAALSPDGKMIAMAYAPPATGVIQFGYTNLYIMAADGASEPTLFIDAGSPEIILHPTWSQDGAYIYYERVEPGPFGVIYSIERVAYPMGQPEVVKQGAAWPILSPDGITLSYIAHDAGGDTLQVEGVDGSSHLSLADATRFLAIEAPRFSPDGSTLIFSAEKSLLQGRADQREAAGMPDWAVWLLGVEVAEAHSSSSMDLWQVSVSGENLIRLTEIEAGGLVAAFAPNGDKVVFVTASSLMIMETDGAQLTRLPIQGTFYTVQWVSAGSE